MKKYTDYLKNIDDECWKSFPICKSCMLDWIENMDNLEKIFVVRTSDEYPRCQNLMGESECGNKTNYILTFDFRTEGLGS